MDRFLVVPPTGTGWHPAVDRLRGRVRGPVRGRVGQVLPRQAADPREYDACPTSLTAGNLVLFGDPQSNPLIAKVLPKLPITWTKDKLVVNGVEYDPKTHVPVLIYPNPLNPSRYVVINSGHTFNEADLKGTNALLYPRLGDWAVIKPTPTEKDPAASEVVAAGLFDENWQFPTKAAAAEELKSFVAPGRSSKSSGPRASSPRGRRRGPDGCDLLLRHRQPHHEVRPEDRQDDRRSATRAAGRTG